MHVLLLGCKQNRQIFKERNLILTKDVKYTNKNFLKTLQPFLWTGFKAVESTQEDSLLLTAHSPGVSGAHLIALRKDDRLSQTKKYLMVSSLGSLSW